MTSNIVRGKMHDVVKPLCWLLGTWRTVCAEVTYPTMKNVVKYQEELVFDHIGQPMLTYSSSTWDPKTKSPMHWERGYLRIHDDCKRIVFLTAQNFGVATLEEGVIEDRSIMFGSKCIATSDLVKKPVNSIYRCYKLNNDGQLEMCMMMETPTVPMTPHLKALYNKCDK